ncbi:MAG: PKD domain-containing protein [Ardenticatenaceae bacterium]|nr:PKD domain-containing protein [Ardenticatenaceae bacterium]
MSLRHRLIALSSTALIAVFMVFGLVLAQEPPTPSFDQSSAASFPLPDASWRHNSIDPGAEYGTTILITDIDGDSDQDIIVGAPFEDDQILGADVGAVYVYLNNIGLLPSSPSQIFKGKHAGDQFGYSLAAGDFKSDANIDLAVGAPGYVSMGTGKNVGAVYILPGIESPSNPLADEGIPTIEGEIEHTQFGYELAAVDNLSTGDDFDELIVGAPEYQGAGAALVYINLTTGFPPAPTFILGEGGNLSHFGYAMSAGDYNGDFYHQEVAVGAPKYEVSGTVDAGAVFVYALTETGTSPNFVYTATVEAAYFGDADGGLLGHDVDLVAMEPLSYTHADLLAGAPGYPIDGSTPGGALIYYQNEYFDPAADAAGRTALFDADWVGLGKQPGGMLGYSIVGTDFDMDGTTDIVGGAKLNDLNHPNEGAIFFYLTQNGSFPPAADPSWMAVGNHADGFFGADLASGDLMSSVPMGPMDVVVGAPGMETGGAVYHYQARSGLNLASQPTLNADSPASIGEQVAFNMPAVGGSDNVYLWNFGDGNSLLTESKTGAGQIISHSYQTAGQYVASLRVMNLAEMAYVTTVVDIVEPVSGLQLTASSPTRLGDPTNFVMTVAAGSPVTYRVDYGDGLGEVVFPAVLSPLAISNTYSSPGIYQAVITAENSINFVTKTKNIAVFKPQNIANGVGGNLTYDFTQGVQAGSKFTVAIPSDAINEDIEVRFTPRPNAGEYPDSGSGLLYFDLNAIPAAEADVSAYVECLFLPYISGGSGNGSGSSTVVNGVTSPCGSLIEYNFLQPVTITLKYPQAIIPNGVSESDMVFEYYDLKLSQWVDGAETCETPSTYQRDTVKNIIRLEICHQSRWSWRPR